MFRSCKILTNWLVLTALAGSGLACNGKGLEPQPAKYLLYAGMIATPPETPQAFVAVIDCETDSIIDSIFYDFGSAVGVGASPDGKYFATVSSRQPPVTIWEAASRLPLAELPRITGAGVPLFLPDAALMLAEDLQETRLYRLPGFELDTVVQVELRRAQRIPCTHRVIGVDTRMGEYYPDDSKLAVFDYVTREEVDSIIINPGPAGVGFQFTSFDVTSDGQALYACGGQREGGPWPGLAGYSLVEDRTLFVATVTRGCLWCQVNPRGDEVWVTSPGPAHGDSPNTSIYIHNAVTGMVIDSVPLTGFREHPELSLAANEIRFLPSGDKAYVNCGSYFMPKGPQPILVIDVQRREVIKLIYEDFRDLAMAIDVAPRP